MNLPTMESMPVEDARAFYNQMSAVRPPGPDVGEMVDGTLPGTSGDLAYRLYRPPTPGPHNPIIVYFHGGGWVLGDAISDDPLCRDLWCEATRFSSRRITVTRPSTGSMPRSTTPWPRCDGSQTMPRHSATPTNR